MIYRERKLRVRRTDYGRFNQLVGELTMFSFEAVLVGFDKVSAKLLLRGEAEDLKEIGEIMTEEGIDFSNDWTDVAGVWLAERDPVKSGYVGQLA